MDHELQTKYEKLKEEIRKLESAIVAFSGGIDSALVLKVAYDALKDKTMAVTADSPSLPRRELEETKKVALEIGARHVVIQTQETENESYLKNSSNRCYFCKSELYSKLRAISKQLNAKEILNGTNLDDLGDHRPGLKAADEFKIISPLKNAGFTKNDVRKLSRHLGIKIWNKPSSPCLSSRVPYGKEITMKKLSMIEEAENYLKDLGLKELRVRHFGETARIEVTEAGKEIVSKKHNEILEKFNQIGFKNLQIENFKSGNLNLMIKNA